ncbi:hypothetical protein HanIR_Chr05g0241101 [Helianthus annuus]|nr:hypothetical protein HanIR_Chr05g0241101 [Helianthus annuus]
MFEIKSHLKSSAASSSLAKQRSMLPDSSSCKRGALNFRTICPCNVVSIIAFS